VLPFRSIRTLSLAFAVAIAAATVATAAGVYWLLGSTIDWQIDKRLLAEQHELMFGAPSREELARRITEEAQRRDSGDIGFLLARGDQRIAGNIAPRHALPPGASTVGADLGVPGLSRGRALVTTTPTGDRLTLVIESEPVDDHDRHRLIVIAAGFCAILLLAVAAVATLGALIRRRIDAVRATADAIVEGDSHARLPVDGSDSVFDRQARSFNHMLDRIDGLMANLRHVSSDIAHDMRSPLARLHTRLSALARSGDGSPEALTAAVADCEQLLAMFAAILRIADVEGGDARAGFALLDWGALTAETAASLDALAEDGGRELRIAPSCPTPILGDRRLLVQLLVNLIENAVHHTPPGTRITIAVRHDGPVAELNVADDGPGIAAADRATALRRFGRLETSRNRPGHGLGLAFADGVARRHGGTLTLDDGAPGLIVRVRVPLAA
jgi:signal transduction histidine kinase